MPENDEYGRTPLGKRDVPLEAVIYFKGISSYQAQVWYSRATGVVKPVIQYVYWIMITDKEFAGRDIQDSSENAGNTLDIIFKEKSGVLDAKGFMFKHFAGPLFRVKFDLDAETFTIKNQYLNI